MILSSMLCYCGIFFVVLMMFVDIGEFDFVS